MPLPLVPDAPACVPYVAHSHGMFYVEPYLVTATGPEATPTVRVQDVPLTPGGDLGACRFTFGTWWDIPIPGRDRILAHVRACIAKDIALELRLRDLAVARVAYLDAL